MKKLARSRYAYIALAALVALILLLALRGGPGRTTISLSQFDHDLSVPGQVVTATIHDGSDSITGKLRDGTSFSVSYPDRLTQTLSDKMLAAGTKVSVSHTKSNVWLDLLGSWLPILVFGGLLLYMLFAMQGGGSRVMQFGKARTRASGKDQLKVTFADVAGADEAVSELQEIKDFLESPGRFHALGARIPKGVLLFGPPGTGKTLLARAVAGEAGVPFFSISGSDFVEMFVGVGASRVRDLFEQAKANAPSIVFMDEIDAVGRHRGAGLGGGHDEREQTLNQLLVEMDSFDVRGGVILIAATNRPDILDPALLRPGRFDRQIVVDRPDLAGRRQILEVHAQGKPLATGADLGVLAKRTPGFTGADLANLLNEAAILTARRNLRQIGMRECEEAIDRVLAGPERKTLVMSESDKLVTAYHEAGHAIVGHVLPHADPIHKVSIVARSRSLGLTYTLPEDRYNHSRSQLRDAMAMCLGGRTAEEIVFAEPTTGAENDIEKVTRIARSMVTEYGMSEILGPQQLGQREGEVFLGRELTHQANYSQEVAALVDQEIRALVDDAHQRARAVLTRHRATLDHLARALVEKETLDSMDLAEILGPLEQWAAGPAPAPGPTATTPARVTTSAPATTPARVTTSARATGPTRPSRPVKPAGKSLSKTVPDPAAKPLIKTASRTASKAAPRPTVKTAVKTTVRTAPIKPAPTPPTAPKPARTPKPAAEPATSKVARAAVEKRAPVAKRTRRAIDEPVRPRRPATAPKTSEP